MSTQWTDLDNVHALGAAACTHQGEVAELQRDRDELRREVRELRKVKEDHLVAVRAVVKSVHESTELQGQVKRLKDALESIAYHGQHSGVICCPQDYGFYIQPMQETARAALAATPDPSEPKET